MTASRALPAAEIHRVARAEFANRFAIVWGAPRRPASVPASGQSCPRAAGVLQDCNCL